MTHSVSQFVRYTICELKAILRAYKLPPSLFFQSNISLCNNNSYYNILKEWLTDSALLLSNWNRYLLMFTKCCMITSNQSQFDNVLPCVYLLIYPVRFVYARLQTGDIMVWWCPSVRPSGSLSVSHSFPHFSPTCFDVLSWNFVCRFLLINSRSSSRIVNVRQLF